MPLNAWTPEKTELLKELLPQHLSASQIGDKLGMTRCAVIGKTHRLGLQLVASTPNRINGAAPRRKRRDGGGGMLISIREKLVEKRETKAVAKQKQLSQPLIMRQLQLVDLEANHCRFPVGEPGQPEFFFCAADADGTYCAHHSRICFNPAKKYADRLLRPMRFSETF